LIQTIPDLFYAALERDFSTAIAHRSGGVWLCISHRELRTRVERLALALEARGLRKGDRLAILSENRPEWAVADYACALSGIVTVPVYPTLNPEQTAYILRHSGARWCVCSTPEQLAKVQELLPGLPELETLVLMAGAPAEGSPVLAWDALLAEGEAREDRRPEVKDRASGVAPGDLLTLIYTSGTTGDPKGAMLSHGNVASNIVAGLAAMEVEPGQRCLSLLPMSHIFERMGGHYTMFHAGVSIYYAESLQTAARDLVEVRPEILLAVPRVFEKFYARVREQVNAGGFAKRLIFHWVAALGAKMAQRRYRDLPLPLWLRAAGAVGDALVFRKVRERLGGRINMAAVGGAAIHPRILEFFWGAGIRLFEGYGMTETSPLLTISRKGDMVPGSVGRPILDTWEGRPFMRIAEDGEILVQGPNVMLGYWRNEAATREAVDAEGWFHTGDVGEMDAEGRVRITDRKKEIIVTSGGKNVAPQPLENALRADKYIEQAVVVGEGRNFIAALIYPDFPNLRIWAEHRKIPFTSDADLASRPEAVAKVMRRVERINARFSNYERIKKVVLLDAELTVDSGLLTPSLKVRRRAVDEAFRDRIDAIYGG